MCNFPLAHLQKLKDETGIFPVVNQIELHPLMQQRQLHSWNATHNIATESWSPLGRRDDLAAEPVVRVAQALGRTPAQVILRWHVQQGFIVFPKSQHRERLAENLALFDFALDDDQMAAVGALDSGHRVGPDPAQFWAKEDGK